VDEFRPVGERFEREHGCTEAEWRGWLPAAVHGHALSLDARPTARIAIGAGTLQLEWQVLAPRRIALLNLPRLQVRYVFSGVDSDLRARFMKRFDLHIQRGGG
jgi:hypothetical protein